MPSIVSIPARSSGQPYGKSEQGNMTRNGSVFAEELRDWILNEWRKIPPLRVTHAEYTKVGDKYDSQVFERCITMSGEDFKFDIVFDFGREVTIVDAAQAMREFVQSNEYRAVLDKFSVR